MKKLTLFAFLLLALFGCSKENQAVVEVHEPNNFAFATDNDVLENFGLYAFYIKIEDKQFEVAALCLEKEDLTQCLKSLENYEYVGRQDIYSYDCEVRGNFHTFIEKLQR